MNKKFKGVRALLLNLSIYVELLSASRTKKCDLDKKNMVESIVKSFYENDIDKCHLSINSLRDMKQGTKDLADILNSPKFNEKILNENLLSITENIDKRIFAEYLHTLILNDNDIASKDKDIFKSYYSYDINGFLFEILKFTIMIGDNNLRGTDTKTEYISRCMTIINDKKEREKIQKKKEAIKTDSDPILIYMKSLMFEFTDSFSWLEIAFRYLIKNGSSKRQKDKKKAYSMWHSLNQEARQQIQFHIFLAKVIPNIIFQIIVLILLCLLLRDAIRLYFALEISFYFAIVYVAVYYLNSFINRKFRK